VIAHKLGRRSVLRRLSAGVSPFIEASAMSEHDEHPTSTHRLVHGQLVYLQIPALDITVSARFYERVFGWQVDPPDSGFEAPALIGQWVTDRPPSPDAGPLGWIHVDDVRATLREAELAGAVAAVALGL
jgi:hypothetical protein